MQAVPLSHAVSQARRGETFPEGELLSVSNHKHLEFLQVFSSKLVPEMSPFDCVGQPLFDCFSVLRNGIHCEFLNYSLPAERI